MTTPTTPPPSDAALDVAAEHGVSPEAFYARLLLGWTVEQAATEPLAEQVTHMLDGRPALDVAAEHGVSQNLFHARLGLGWTVEKAATTPVQKRGGRPAGLVVAGRPALDVAAEHGVSRWALYRRIRSGWTVERAATEPMPRSREAQAASRAASERAPRAPRARVELSPAELEMMRAAGVIGQTFAARMRAGWDRAAALSTCVAILTRTRPRRHGAYAPDTGASDRRDSPTGTSPPTREEHVCDPPTPSTHIDGCARFAPAPSGAPVTESPRRHRAAGAFAIWARTPRRNRRTKTSVIPAYSHESYSALLRAD